MRVGVGGLGHFLGRAEMLLEIVAALTIIVEAVRRDSKDRVLLFEAAAFVTFFLGLPLLKFSGFFWPGVVIWLMLFFGFALAAVYLAIINWRRRTKRVS